MSDSPALVVSHVSAADEALRWARAVDGVHKPTAVDLLVYARSAGHYPPPPGVRRIDMPTAESKLGLAVAALRWIARLRRSHYSHLIVVQPGLSTSHGRGV